MPRMLLHTPYKTEIRQDALLENAGKRTSSLTQAQIHRLLGQKRSKKYLEALSRLDAGGHVMNKPMVDALLAAIREEMPELTIDMQPLGIVSKCYLGENYEVHTLNVTGQIIEHYRAGHSLPGLLERARVLAQNPNYEFIEVYPDSMRAVKSDGSVATIKGA